MFWEINSENNLEYYIYYIYTTQSVLCSEHVNEIIEESEFILFSIFRQTTQRFQITEVQIQRDVQTIGKQCRCKHALSVEIMPGVSRCRQTMQYRLQLGKLTIAQVITIKIRRRWACLLAVTKQIIWENFNISSSEFVSISWRVCKRWHGGAWFAAWMGSAMLDLSGGLTPSGASQPPKFSLTPQLV